MKKNIIKEHMLKYLDKGTRLDGRKFDQYRDVKVEYGIAPRTAEGSVRVTIGDTEVIAGVKTELGTPYADKPGEGSIIINAELLPLASPEFDTGPPSINSIELSRVVDRVIRESGALNFKKLCVKKGEKVWLVIIDIYPINDAGNLFDAALLAAVAAVKDARFPKVEDDQVQYGNLSTKKLPLEFVPTSHTVWKIGEHLIIDPTVQEQSVADARLLIGVMPEGKLCAMQKGGDVPLTEDEIYKMTDMAIKHSDKLRKKIK
jgi:exosome complex component RRP42